MSEQTPETASRPGIRTKGFPGIRPRDAATLIIVDRAAGVPRVLMGKRRIDMKFMPGKYVFPGGRMDAFDKVMPAARELAPLETTKLLHDMKGRPSTARARGLALAAVRETFEEAGIIIGHAGEPAPSARVPRPDGDAAERMWTAFLGHGFGPSLSDLTLFARAITPPGRPRRFDTRFFCVEAAAISKATDHNDGELSGLEWISLESARDLDLPPITRVILEDLADRLKRTTLSDATMPIPYYYNRHGTFRRDLVTFDADRGSTA